MNKYIEMHKRYCVESDFIENGLRCIVIFTDSGHRCGYVGVTKNNILYGKEYDNFDLDCHGGLTYSGGGEKSTYPVSSDLWWFGFDCAHCDDADDYNTAIEYFPAKRESINAVRAIMSNWGGIVRTKEYVESECRSLAHQIANLMRC